MINLVESFETPFDLKLLTTVHWVVTHENARMAEKAAARDKNGGSTRILPHQALCIGNRLSPALSASICDPYAMLHAIA